MRKLLILALIVTSGWLMAGCGPDLPDRLTADNVDQAMAGLLGGGNKNLQRVEHTEIKPGVFNVQVFMTFDAFTEAGYFDGIAVTAQMFVEKVLANWPGQVDEVMFFCHVPLQGGGTGLAAKLRWRVPSLAGIDLGLVTGPKFLDRAEVVTIKPVIRRYARAFCREHGSEAPKFCNRIR